MQMHTTLLRFVFLNKMKTKTMQLIYLFCLFVKAGIVTIKG